MRGPHDDEVEGQNPGKDHARERLDDFLKRREPSAKPAKRPNDPNAHPKPDPKP